MDPRSATLSVGLNALGDLVSVVIVPRHVGQVWHVYYVMAMLRVGRGMLKRLLVRKIGRIGNAHILFLCRLNWVTLRLSLAPVHLFDGGCSNKEEKARRADEQISFVTRILLTSQVVLAV